DAIHTPLPECMRQRGLLRAQQFTCAIWRNGFDAFIEKLLDSTPRRPSAKLDVTVQQSEVVVAASARRALVPLRVTNRGTSPACPDGPARTRLCCEVIDPSSGNSLAELQFAELPGLLLPGQTQAAALSLAIPGKPGRYEARVWAERETGRPTHDVATSFELVL